METNENRSVQRYADILSDAGFKAVFGDKGNKEARLDLRCEGTDGTKFIVEMQKRMQPNFFRRCISYAAKVYDTGTGKKDRDRYEIQPVYVIAILNGKMRHEDETEWGSECISRYSFMEHRTKEFAQETISAIFVHFVSTYSSRSEKKKYFFFSLA